MNEAAPVEAAPRLGPSAVEAPAPPRRGAAVAGLLMALLIIVGAWFVGARQGFGQLGFSGVNSSLLPKVGDPAPDFVTVLSDGSVVRLSDFRGQPVWLNFWGSWCPPCRAEMPDMEGAYQQLRPRGLVMLAVALDEPPSVSFDYAARNGATYLVASDPERKTTGNAYPIVNFPTHILIDRDGIVRQIVLAELDQEEFVTYAETILGSTDAT